MRYRRRALMLSADGLPTGYTTLDCISCEKKYYFPTDYCVSSTDKVVWGARLAAMGQNSFFGSVDSAGRGFSVFTANNRFGATHGDKTNTVLYFPGLSLREYTYKDSIITIIGARDLSAFSDAAFKSDRPLYIAAINDNGSPLNPFDGDMYYLQIYSAKGALKRSYVPCIRKNDGTEGLFELMYQSFIPKTLA